MLEAVKEISIIDELACRLKGADYGNIVNCFGVARVRKLDDGGFEFSITDMVFVVSPDGSVCGARFSNGKVVENITPDSARDYLIGFLKFVE